MVDEKNNACSDFRYRELILEFLKHDLSITVSDNVQSDGDIHFSISLKNSGLNLDIYTKYKDAIFSDFFANFLGELLVRENINMFSKILTDKVGAKDYYRLVNTYEHRQFGMEINRNDLIFSFHISLLQSILTESFKKKLHCF